MSVTSSVLRPASGLENATWEQKLDCTKEKMASGTKFALAQGAVAAGTLGAGVAIATHKDLAEKVVDKFVSSKAGSKIAKSGLVKNIKSGAKEMAVFVKKNPKVAGLAAGVLAISTVIGGALSYADVRKNGKIEGKYQERANHANLNKEA